MSPQNNWLSSQNMWASNRLWLSGSSDPLNYIEQPRKSPLTEIDKRTAQKDYDNGIHSRIPECCVVWFIGRYSRATRTSSARYIRLLKKYHDECRYLFQPGFIPCPKTIRAKDLVFLHSCETKDCGKTKENYLTETMRMFYDPLGASRLGEVTQDAYVGIIHPTATAYLQDGSSRTVSGRIENLASANGSVPTPPPLPENPWIAAARRAGQRAVIDGTGITEVPF